MAFSYVQGAFANGDNKVSLTSVAAGNLIVVYFGQDNPTTGGTYTCSDGTSSLVAVTSGDGTYHYCRMFYLLSANSGNRTYTVTGDAYSTQVTAVMEFSYSGTCEYDQQNHNSGDGSGSITTGNITTTGTAEVCICAAGGYASGNLSSQQIGGTNATGTLDSTGGENSMWYRITTLSGGQGTATDPSSGYWAAQIISFKEASVGGKVSKNTRSFPLGIFAGMKRAMGG